MKKLIIALIAVTMGVAANAGSVRWKTYDVVGTNGSGIFDGGMAYLFTTAVSASDVEASVLAGTFLDSTSGYAKDAIYTSTINDGEFDTGNILKDVYSGSTTLWMLAIDDNTSANYYFVGENITKSIGSTGAQNFSWTYGDNTTAWTAVPEPTSGMLLLLGMAGLALRRRRA